jgi:hypothetical protein
VKAVDAWKGGSFSLAHPMNKQHGYELIAYSLVLAALSYFAHYLAPSVTRITLITGLIGGALCLVWGVRILLGNRGKALPLLTLIPVSFILLSQSVLTWAGGAQEVSGRRMAALVITVLTLFSLGTLMMVVCAGIVFDESPASPTKNERTK